jgi:hypothetical protein
MNIDTGVKVILRFCLRNMRGCDVGITDGRDFLITPLIWAQAIYVPIFINIGSGIPSLIGVIHRHTHRQQGDLISLLLFFQNTERRLKLIIVLPEQIHQVNL